MHDAALVPLVRVVQIKLGVLVTMSENERHVLRFEVTDGLLANAQHNVVGF